MMLLLLLALGGNVFASELAIAPVDNQTGAIGARTIVRTWDTPSGFSHVRTYVSGGNPYVVVLDQITGTLEIRDLDGGDIGSNVWFYQLGRRFTSMEIASLGGTLHLVL